MDHPRRGSFADVAVVTVCLLCLLAIIPAAVLYSRDAERDQRTRQSYHQIGIALQSYHQTWNSFPNGARRAR